MLNDGIKDLKQRQHLLLLCCGRLTDESAHRSIDFILKKCNLFKMENLERNAWLGLSHYPVKNNLSRSCRFVCRSEISLFQQNEAIISLAESTCQNFMEQNTVWLGNSINTVMWEELNSKGWRGKEWGIVANSLFYSPSKKALGYMMNYH